ncbi:MAG TPA: rod shape-determining protein RodA [Ruminococcaceae bacterium]|nr:rod shape-determining protein RodA [Oscillospiraceae bacterium]
MGAIITRVADFFRESDKLFLSLCLLASGYGCIAVFSATRYLESNRPFLVHAGSVFLGLIVSIIISLVDFQKIVDKWYYIAALGLIPVILTFFIGFAPAGTDDKAWLDLGFTTFQPSEFLKICFIITFSAHLSGVKSNINKLKYLIPVCLHGIFPVVLIHIQGDDGTALVFLIMVLCMLYAAGVSWKYFLGAFLTLVITSPLIYYIVMNDDQRSRIISTFNIEADVKGSTYQSYYGRTALANGRIFGQGLFKGVLTQSGRVPEGQNDFIFVSIGEELGMIGLLVVLILLTAIALRSLRVAAICIKDSGKLICVGFFSMVFAQVLINVGMCTALLPVIGVTLPFFSAGGTSLLCMFMGVGLVLNVYKHKNLRTLYLHE